MTSIDSTKFLERVRFFDDERLIAPDLQAIDDFARQMRWLHNRSLHQPGVASGFTVTGEKGDREVNVQSGYALDALGREIVLTQPFIQPVPPTSGDGQGGSAFYDLTVSYPATLPVSESRSADCGVTQGVVRLRDSPVFCWVSTLQGPLRDEIEKGLRIVLARAEVLNCKLNSKVSVAQRLEARPSVHPFVFAGVAAPKWVVTTSAFGVQVVPPALIGAKKDGPQTEPIDTSAAGFRTVPCYFANLATDPIIELNSQSMRLEVSVSIAFPTITGFTVALLIPSLPLILSQLQVDQVAAQVVLKAPTWKLEWMGVEA